MNISPNIDYKLLHNYYLTSTIFLLITAAIGSYYLIVQLAGFTANTYLITGIIHLGTLGVITLGLFGMYLRIFSSLPSVSISAKSITYLFWMIVMGAVVLFLGMITANIVALGAGAFLVIFAAFWWAINYFRWYFQAPSDRRGGVLLFGLFGAIGLVVAVLLGGYLLHGYVTHTSPVTAKLSHIHAGLVGWASMGLLGVGVAFRGGELPVTRSIGALSATAWVWLTGFILLVLFMVLGKLPWLVAPAALLLIGYLVYGYSMPKVGKLGSDDSENSASIGGAMLFIILGFIGLFLVLLLGFDVAMNYPNGQVGLHSIAGVGGWLLMMILLSLLSEMPRTSYALLQESIADSALPDRADFYTLPGIKPLWGILLVGLIGYMAGNYAGDTVQWFSGLILGVTVVVICLLMLTKYRGQANR